MNPNIHVQSVPDLYSEFSALFYMLMSISSIESWVLGLQMIHTICHKVVKEVW